MSKGQSKTVSLIEVVSSTLIGFATSIVTQILVFPLFDIEVTYTEQFGLALIFMCVSIARGYLVRRLFNWLGLR